METDMANFVLFLMFCLIWIAVYYSYAGVRKAVSAVFSG